MRSVPYSAHENNFAYRTAMPPDIRAPAQKGNAFRKFFLSLLLDIKSNLDFKIFLTFSKKFMLKCKYFKSESGSTIHIIRNGIILLSDNLPYNIELKVAWPHQNYRKDYYEF